MTTPPTNIRIFHVPAPLDAFDDDAVNKPRRRVEVCLGMELHVLPGWGQYFIFSAGLPSEDSVFVRLSNFMPDHPLGFPDPSGHRFWMKTYSENQGILEAMVEEGILEVVPGENVKQGFVTFPLVRVKIQPKELAKKCGWCERWEVPARVNDKPGERFLACARCKRTWYCSADCQKKSWTQSTPSLLQEDYPPHKDICRK